MCGFAFQLAIVVMCLTYTPGQCIRLPYKTRDTFQYECNIWQTLNTSSTTRKSCLPSKQDCTRGVQVFLDGKNYKHDCNTCSCHNGSLMCTCLGCIGIVDEWSYPVISVSEKRPSFCFHHGVFPRRTNIQVKSTDDYGVQLKSQCIPFQYL